MKLRRVSLVVNTDRPGAMAVAARAKALLEAAGASAGVVEVGMHASFGLDDLAPGTDLIVTLGGDGTILAASRVAAPHGVPILGVHLGRFGFIAEAHPETLDERLKDLLEGRYQIEERVMVHGQVFRGDRAVHEAFGLNDVVINRGAMTRMLQMSTRIGQGPAMEYVADGVIVATPTGSTAYSLSVGGPLIAPTVRALLVVPICPHTLAARPIVVPDDQTITIVVESDGGEVRFTADSASVFSLLGGDEVRVRRSDHTTRLVVFHSASFYEKVHERLLWGERVNE